MARAVDPAGAENNSGEPLRQQRRGGTGRRRRHRARSWREGRCGQRGRHGRLRNKRDRHCRNAAGDAQERPSHVTQTPPASAAARLSAWPRFPTPAGRSSSGSGLRPRERAAATSPSAITDALEPRPRSGDAVDPAEAPTRNGGQLRKGADADVVEVGPPSLSSTSSLFQRSSATATQSKPGPTFAVLAGARTRILTGRRQRLRRGPAR